MFSVVLAIILIISVIIIEVVDELYKKKYKVKFKSIKEINSLSFFAVIGFLLAYSNFPFDTLIENNIEWDKILLSIFQFILGISFLIRFQKRDLITEEKIITKEGNIKWKDVWEYKWLDRSKNSKYIVLILKVKNSKIGKKISGFEHNEVSFRAYLEEKEEIDIYLEEKLGEK